MPWFKLDLQGQLKGSVTMRRPGNEKQGLGVHGLAFLGLLETTRAARREEKQAESQEQANVLGSAWLDPFSSELSRGFTCRWRELSSASTAWTGWTCLMWTIKMCYE